MITLRSLSFFGVFLVFLVAILAISAVYYLRNRRRNLYPYGEWDELIDRLIPIDHRSLARVAGDPEAQFDLHAFDVEAMDAEEIWDILGGMEGIDIMEANCTVLVDLVFYVQQWYPEALVIAEQLRLNAREVEWHIGRIRAAAKSGRGRVATAEYLKQAVSIYYRMTCEVLALYEQGNLPGLADLQRSI